MTTGERLREKRRELGLSQLQLAEILGYSSSSSISKFELEREIPAEMITEFAKALKCSEAYLTGIADSSHKKQKIELLPDEKALLYAYRSFSPENKTAVRALIGLLTRRQRKQKECV